MPSRPAVPPRPAQPPRPADHLRLVQPPAAAPPARAGAAAAGVAASAARSPLRPAAPRAFGDWMLNGLGVGAAAASAAFATYALVFSTGEVVPSGNFNVFARYDRLYQGGARTLAPPGATPSGNRTDVASGDAVDFTPTGSVGPEPDAPQADRTGPPTPRGSDGPPLPDFTLRDVFDGKALVESHASLSVVKPGSVIDGAGEVLSIEKRGTRWVVLTANGVIAGQRR